jgi:hypothetical protein
MTLISEKALSGDSQWAETLSQAQDLRSNVLIMINAVKEYAPADVIGT